MDFILDIGNGSVGAALVEKGTRADKPRILSSARELVLFDEKPSGSALQHAIFRALDTVIVQTLKKGTRYLPKGQNAIKIEKVLCTLSSPWFVSKGKTISLSQEKEFVLSADFLNDVLVKESQNFKISQNEISKTRIIERMIVGGTVDGYSLLNVIGKKTNKADLSVYMSWAEAPFIEAIEKSVHTHVAPHLNVIFHTFPFAVFSTIREIFPQTEKYIHFDVAGEITDVSIVRRNMIEKTVTYPSGKNVLIRAIAKSFGVPGDAARSLFHICIERRADASVVEKVTAAITEAEKEWSEYLDEVLEGVTVGKVFLTAYPQTAEIFESFLYKKNFASIVHIDQDFLAQFVGTTPALDLDIFLGIETFFLSRFL